MDFSLSSNMQNKLFFAVRTNPFWLYNFGSTFALKEKTYLNQLVYHILVYSLFKELFNRDAL
jgi:hypothetical protein